jgi:hypothetical protein
VREKPVLRLSRLLTCDLYEPNFYGETMMARGSIIHAAIEAEMREKLENHDVRAEYELKVEREFYVLVGHPDLLDVTEKVVYEIKPITLRDIYALQLSAYIEMAETVFGGSWAGKFVLYDRDMHYVVQDFYPLPNALKYVDDVAMAKLFAHKTGKVILRKGFCGFCRRRAKCPLVDMPIKWMVAEYGRRG